MDGADAAAMARAAAGLGLSLEPATIERLGRLVDLLALWNERFRLTGERDPRILVRKHVVDSLALVAHLPQAGPIADLGSGAGFPGLVVACARPALDVLLVESRRRPASFLGEAVRSIGLPEARVIHARAEEVGRDPAWRGRVRVATARGLRFDSLLSLAGPLLAPDGRVVAMQTPRTAGQAAVIASRSGFQQVRRVDYRLPAGEQRCLLFFNRLC